MGDDDYGPKHAEDLIRTRKLMDKANHYMIIGNKDEHKRALEEVIRSAGGGNWHQQIYYDLAARRLKYL